MFFPNRIKSINDGDLVLEIGPGATPYWRSDIFLELQYNDVNERIAQSGKVGVLETSKKIIYYEGGSFPFKDKEFDYVVCSHVLEHVKDVPFFLSELQRVAKCGYIEYPTFYYDYLYDFEVHINLLFYKNKTIFWMKKEDCIYFNNRKITELFRKSCDLGYHNIIQDLKLFFFQGFEWNNEINCQKSILIEDFLHDESSINNLPLKPKIETKNSFFLMNFLIKIISKIKSSFFNKGLT